MVSLNLTAKQTAFADGLLDGRTGSDAYRFAYNTRASNRVVAGKAVGLRKNPAVQAYVAREQSKLDHAKTLTRIEKRQILAEIVNDPKSTAMDKIKAIVLDNRMCGHDKPEAAESFRLDDLLALVRSSS